MNPLANAAHFATDGYRDHSAAERNTFNARARWLVMAGARNSVVDMKSHNHLPLTSGAADSGVRFLAFNPVAGVTYRVSPALNVYGAYGRGFETPTLNDLAYRSTDGSSPGLNFVCALREATTTSWASRSVPAAAPYSRISALRSAKAQNFPSRPHAHRTSTADSPTPTWRP